MRLIAVRNTWSDLDAVEKAAVTLAFRRIDTGRMGSRHDDCGLITGGAGCERRVPRLKLLS